MPTRLLPPLIAADHPLLGRRFAATGYADATLADLVGRLRAAGDPLAIVLFGSWARGEGRPESDLDFLVIVPEPRRTGAVWDRLIQALLDAPLRCDVLIASPTTLAAVAGVPGFAEQEALRDGICLYRRPRRHAAAIPLLSQRKEGDGLAEGT